MIDVRGAAYILHQRPYRNTSAIVEFITPSQGRVSAVVKGVSNRKKYGSSLQPFHLLEIHCRGRGDLLNLQLLEPQGTSHRLQGMGLYCGLYINELVSRFLPRYDEDPDTFAAYCQGLQRLSDGGGREAYEVALRCFEVGLFCRLGYGLDFECSAQGEPFDPEQRYVYRVDEGFYPVATEVAGGLPVVTGSVLLAMAREDYSSTQVKQEAKRLMRAVINHYLAGRTLKSRELFVQ